MGYVLVIQSGQGKKLKKLIPKDDFLAIVCHQKRQTIDL
jgi:hypothetical protein